MKTSMRKAGVAGLAACAIVVSLWAAPDGRDADPTTLKVIDGRGDTVAIVTLLHGAKVLPMTVMSESPVGYHPDKYQVRKAGVQVVSRTGEQLFAIGEPGTNGFIEYEFAARLKK